MSWGKTWNEMTLTEQRLLVAAEEGTELGNITLRETDHLPTGVIREYPAMDPTECSQILLRWFESGLIDVYRVIFEPPWSDDISPEKARQVLGDPSSWSFNLGVSLSEDGRRTEP
jgi:hypothetical protein